MFGTPLMNSKQGKQWTLFLQLRIPYGLYIKVLRTRLSDSVFVKINIVDWRQRSTWVVFRAKHLAMVVTNWQTEIQINTKTKQNLAKLS